MGGEPREAGAFARGSAEDAGKARRAGVRKNGLFKTGELIRRSGLSRQVIYNYVTMGLIDEADHTPKGHKLFSDDAVRKLKLIQKLQEVGYTLRDIKDIFFKDGKKEERS